MKDTRRRRPKEEKTKKNKELAEKEIRKVGLEMEDEMVEEPRKETAVEREEEAGYHEIEEADSQNLKYADTRSAADPYCQHKPKSMNTIPYISTIGLGAPVVLPEKLDRASM